MKSPARVLLINGYYKRETSSIKKSASSADTPPLGIGYVGTYIRDHTDCHVEIVDPIPQGLSENELLNKAKGFDYIGISCYTDIRYQCFELAAIIKQRYPKCIVMVGGPHTYHLDSLILKHYPYLDVIVRGEGEVTAAEIVSGKPFEEIKGISYLRNGELIRNPDRPFLEDIDDLYINYNLMPDMSLYSGDTEATIDTQRLKTVYMIESRGCPFKCSYCANDHWKRSWRATSAKKIVDKMEALMREQGIQYFRFYDDLFTADRKRVMAFCEEIKSRKLDVNFRVLVRAGTDKAILEALKDAGCESVGFGIESGSDSMLKRIKKGITRKQIIQTLQDCQDLNLWSVSSFIISLPDETREDLKQTISLMKYPDTFQINVLMIYPYTPFYNELKEKGEINDEVWFDTKVPSKIYYTKESFPSASFDLSEITWLNVYCLYYSYLSSPMALFRRHGAIGGALRYIKALVDIPLRGRLDALYHKYIFR